jgi:gamma-glutamylcyclotransferase (GGCT)/AIG2-like uncharacterized protein YtfP
MHNVFTYGSLMFEAVWRKVTIKTYHKTDGILFGYARKAVVHEEYPALVKSNANSAVKGVVYMDVSPKDLLRLDVFEGEYYIRNTGQVVLTENHTIDVVFYVLKPNYRHILSDQEWDLEHFNRVGIHNFLKQYCGFENMND